MLGRNLAPYLSLSEGRWEGLGFKGEWSACKGQKRHPFPSFKLSPNPPAWIVPTCGWSSAGQAGLEACRPMGPPFALVPFGLGESRGDYCSTMPQGPVGETDRQQTEKLGDMVSIGQIRLSPAGPAVTPTAGRNSGQARGRGPAGACSCLISGQEHLGPWAGAAREAPAPALTWYPHGPRCGRTPPPTTSALTGSTNTSRSFAKWGPERDELLLGHAGVVAQCVGSRSSSSTCFSSPRVPLRPWPSFLAGPGNHLLSP